MSDDCPFCGKTIRLNNAGEFYSHKLAGRHCFGSRRKPHTATIGLAGPEEAIAVCMTCGTVKSGRLKRINGKKFFEDHKHLKKVD